MFTWSMFVSHFQSNRAHMPTSVSEPIRLEAIRRLEQRQAEGRGDCPLLFDDLVERIERALMPA